MDANNLKVIIDNLSDALIVHDLDGHIIRVNSAMLRLYGLTEENYKDYTIKDLSFYTPGVENLINELCLKVQEGETVIREWDGLKPIEKQMVHLQITLKKILWSGQEVIMAVIKDIGELKEAKKSILEVTQKQASMLGTLDMVPFNFWMIDEYNSFAIQNKTSKLKWGNCISKNIIETEILPSHKKELISAVNFVRNNNIPYKQENKVIFEDKILFFLDIVSPIFIDQTFKGVLGVSIDISENKATEALLELKISEFERFEKLVVSRELQMIELKKRIKELEAKCN